MIENRVMIEQSQARRFEVDHAMRIVEYFSRADDPQVSLVIGELDGRHGRRRNSRSVKLYYVISGAMDAEVDGNTYSMGPRDALLVRPGELHAIHGRNSNVMM